MNMLSQSTLINILILLVVVVVGYIVVKEMRNIRQQVKIQKAQIKKMKQELMHGVIESDMTNIDFRRQIEPQPDPIPKQVFYPVPTELDYPGYDEVEDATNPEDGQEDDCGGQEDNCGGQEDDDCGQEDNSCDQEDDNSGGQEDSDEDDNIGHEDDGQQNMVLEQGTHLEDKVAEKYASREDNGDQKEGEMGDQEIVNMETIEDVGLEENRNQISDDDKTEEIDLSLYNKSDDELDKTNIDDIFQDDEIVQNDEPLELNFRRPKLRLQFKKK